MDRSVGSPAVLVALTAATPRAKSRTLDWKKCILRGKECDFGLEARIEVTV